MKSPDKFLIGIIIGVVVLLAVVFGVVLTRPADEYQSEDTPAGIAHNYLLALQNEDYERAYSYLSPNLRGYPASVIEFKHDLENDRWRFRTDSSISLSIQSTALLAENRALVEVREIVYYSGNLFSNSQATIEFDIFLFLEAGKWKVMDADYYFSGCWINTNSCDFPGLLPIP